MFRRGRRPATSSSEPAASSLDGEKRSGSRLNKWKSYIHRSSGDPSSSGVIESRESGALIVPSSVLPDEHVQGSLIVPSSVLPDGHVQDAPETVQAVKHKASAENTSSADVIASQESATLGIQNLANFQVELPAPSDESLQDVPKATIQPPQKEPILCSPASVSKPIRPISGLWDEAYACLNDKNPELVKDYGKCLTKRPNGTALAIATNTTAMAFFGMSKIELHEQMMQDIKSRIEDNESKKWKMQFYGHELAVKDLIKPMVGIMEAAKEYVGTALEASPIGSAAWAGVCLLTQFMLNPSTQGEARMKALSQITILLSQCRMREELYKRRYENDTNDDDFRQSAFEHTTYKDYLRDLYVKILQFLAICTVYLDQNAIVRTTREVVTWDGWASLSAEILDQETALLAVELRFDAFKVQEEWEKQQNWNKQKLAEDQALVEEVSRIAEMMKDKKRTQLLEWLTNINVDLKYNDERQKHQKGTGNWLVEGEQYEQWKNTPNSVLWIHGKAGAGKSNLSATAIHALMADSRDNDQIVVTYFYFDFRDTQKQNAKGMVRSLIYQICKRRPVMPPLVTRLWDQYRHNTKAQEPGLKDDLLPALKEALVGFKDIYIVLDGLDECSSDNDNLRTILTTLNTIYDWSSNNLHLMITSRFIGEIHERLSNIMAINGNIEIDLHNVKEVDDDIRKYILAELSEHGAWSEAEKDSVGTALIEKAEGMFQYVALQLQGPLRRAKTSFQRANALRNLPQGLNETYERVLLSIPIEDRAQAIRALKWLVASLRPLWLSEVAEASRIDLERDPILEDDTQLDSPMSVLEMLPPGLLMFSANRGQVLFAHSSFPEYLCSANIRGPNSDAGEFYINQETASIHIAESCMAYHVYACRTGRNVVRRVSIEFPLWTYAACYWMRHLEHTKAPYWTSKQRSLADSILQPRSEILFKMIQIFDPEDRWVYDECSADEAEPLYYVALGGHLQLLTMLLDRPDNRINVVNGRLGTALNVACCSGKSDIVRELLKQGADPWLGNEMYPCALTAAILSSIEIVDQLVTFGSEGDLFTKCCAVGYSPLEAAVRRKSVEMVVYLLEHGIPVDSQGSYYGTALQYAIYTEVYRIIGILLRAGANVNVQAGRFGNALQTAAARGNDTLMTTMLEKGAAINAQSGMYGTALQSCFLNGWIGTITNYMYNNRDEHTLESIRLLLDRGADVNAPGGKYGHALQAAAYRGHMACARALVSAGAIVNSEGGFYGNALQAARVGEKREMMDYLVEVGAKVQPPGLKFEAVLARVQEGVNGHEQAESLQKFQQGLWHSYSDNPDDSLVPDSENKQVDTPEPYVDPFTEWWSNLPPEWKVPWDG